MKNRLLCAFLMQVSVCGAQTIETVDFDMSMELARYTRAIAMTDRVVELPGQELYDLFKNLYNKHHAAQLQPQATLIIPKIIHQVWLGGAVPEVFLKYMDTWKKHHPDWKYMLWTDENVGTLKLYNQKFFDAITDNGRRSDILKWELIYYFGGVYVDTDFECIRALDQLHYTYDFYTGIQPLDSQYLQLGAALFAAHPKHPILAHCIATIADDWHKKGAPASTGPIHFTRSFFAVAGKNNSRDIAFPASYFYPLGCQQQDTRWSSWQKPESMAIHWWAKSWMPANYRPAEFKNLGNEKVVTTWNDMGQQVR